MRQRRQLPQYSAGEVDAYRMGLELARQANTRTTRQVRREVQVREDEVILIEEETWVEETRWERY